MTAYLTRLRLRSTARVRLLLPAWQGQAVLGAGGKQVSGLDLKHVGEADCKSVGLRLPRFESWICHKGQRLRRSSAPLGS